MQILRNLASWLGVGFVWSLHLLPNRAIAAVGRAIGGILYRFGRGRVTDINLALCFPEMPVAQRKAIGLAHFRGLGRALAEQSIFWFGTEKRALDMVWLTGRENFDRVAHGPVILFAPHSVGLNIGGTGVSHAFPGGACYYSRQKNPVFDKLLMDGRLRFGHPVLFARQEGMLPAVRALRAGKHFYFLPDMDFGARDALFVPFFGVPAATVTALPRLAKVSGAKVVPVVTRQHPHGYEVVIHPAWEDYPSGDLEADVRRMNAFIEDRVREAPEQYFWAHKRFKTRPPGERSPYEDP